MTMVMMAIQTISAMVEACWPFLDNTPDKVALMKNTMMMKNEDDNEDDDYGSDDDISGSDDDVYIPQATRLLLLRTLWEVTRGVSTFTQTTQTTTPVLGIAHHALV